MLTEMGRLCQTSDPNVTNNLTIMDGLLIIFSVYCLLLEHVDKDSPLNSMM